MPAFNLSKCFGHLRPIKGHLVKYRQSGMGYGAEIAVLRNQVDLAFGTLEERKEYPEVTAVDLAATSLSMLGGVLKVNGKYLLNEQNFDSLIVQGGTGGTAYTIGLYSMQPGQTGLSIEFVQGAGPTLSRTGDKFTIQADFGDGYTADALATLINTDGEVTQGVLRAYVQLGEAQNVEVMAETPLAGGSDTYGIQCHVAGEECTPYHDLATTQADAAFTDEQLRFTVPDLTGKVSSDGIVSISVTSDKVRALDVTVPIANLLPDSDKPMLDHLDIGGGAALLAGGGDVIVVGRNILQGQTFDTLRIVDDPTASPPDYDLHITALKPGVSGYSIVFDGNGTAENETVALADGVFTIAMEAGVSTADQIATAINADGADSEGLIRANVVETNTMPDMVETPLAGGAGSGVTILVGGESCLPSNEPGTTSIAKISDTALNITSEAVGAAGDFVTLYIISNGVISNSLSAILA